jgi:hypothetical protein
MDGFAGHPNEELGCVMEALVVRKSLGRRGIAEPSPTWPSGYWTLANASSLQIEWSLPGIEVPEVNAQGQAIRKRVARVIDELDSLLPR